LLGGRHSARTRARGIAGAHARNRLHTRAMGSRASASIVCRAADMAPYVHPLWPRSNMPARTGGDPIGDDHDDARRVPRVRARDPERNLRNVDLSMLDRRQTVRRRLPMLRSRKDWRLLVLCELWLGQRAGGTGGRNSDRRSTVSSEPVCCSARACRRMRPTPPASGSVFVMRSRPLTIGIAFVRRRGVRAAGWGKAKAPWPCWSRVFGWRVALGN
jgi:hypothetical protein